MPRILLLVEFDGSAFHGWQQQAERRTVQSALTAAVAGMVKHPVVLRASSRTDAGVHSWGLPVVFDTTCNIPSKGYELGLNAVLDPDLSVVSAREVEPHFDPRRSSLGKTYRYQVWNRALPSALRARYAWHVPRPLELPAMRAASALLLGEHDFSAFRAAHCDSKSVHRFMESIAIERESDGLVWMDIRANAFLRNMARIVAGTLVEVGLGRRSVDDVGAALASRDRARAGRTAPAHGLFLKEVRYP
jgi:tRNA pseudouridine38-40 synthase